MGARPPVCLSAPDPVQAAPFKPRSILQHGMQRAMSAGVPLLLQHTGHQATYAALGRVLGRLILQVVQHSQAAAATVANEVDVMMSWPHPNLVSAYHFVTWRRRKHPAIRHHSGDQVCVRMDCVGRNGSCLCPHAACGVLFACSACAGAATRKAQQTQWQGGALRQCRQRLCRLCC